MLVTRHEAYRICNDLLASESFVCCSCLLSGRFAVSLVVFFDPHGIVLVLTDRNLLTPSTERVHVLFRLATRRLLGTGAEKVEGRGRLARTKGGSKARDGSSQENKEDGKEGLHLGGGAL